MSTRRRRGEAARRRGGSLSLRRSWRSALVRVAPGRALLKPAGGGASPCALSLHSPFPPYLFPIFWTIFRHFQTTMADLTSKDKKEAADTHAKAYMHRSVRAASVERCGGSRRLFYFFHTRLPVFSRAFFAAVGAPERWRRHHNVHPRRGPGERPRAVRGRIRSDFSSRPRPRLER